MTIYFENLTNYILFMFLIYMSNFVPIAIYYSIYKNIFVYNFKHLINDIANLWSFENFAKIEYIKKKM